MVEQWKQTAKMASIWKLLAQLVRVQELDHANWIGPDMGELELELEGSECADMEWNRGENVGLLRISCSQPICS